MNKASKLILFVGLILSILQFSCKENLQKGNTNKVKTISPGEALYKQYCQSCHKSDGSGVPDLYPSLTGENIRGNKDTLIRIVLLDIERELIVKEGIPEQEMPGQNYLTNYEIAFITSYIREEFGGIADPVSQDEVAAVREKQY